MKASEYIQQWCDEHGGNGDDWKEVVSIVSPNDVFNFNTIQYYYRTFDVKHVYYTGRSGLIHGQRWALAKHFLLSQDSPWRCGTERLLWVYEDKPNDLLEYECKLTMENMENCPFDIQWLCDFNMFRVASAMKSVANRKIASADLFCIQSRKLEDYDPYYRPQGMNIQGTEWLNVLEVIGNIEFSGI